MHYEKDLDNFAKDLLLASTKNGAKALNLNSGVLEIGKSADIISFRLPDKIENMIDWLRILYCRNRKFSRFI